VRATFLLAASLVPIAAASGQMVSAHAVVAAPRHNAHFAGVTERMDGLWVGGAVEFEVGRLRLSGSGMRGRVTSPDPGSVPKRDVGELSLNGTTACVHGSASRCATPPRVQFRGGLPTLGLPRRGCGWVARSRDAGGACLRQPSVFPMVSVSHQEKPRFALGSDAGIAVAPSRLPL